MGVMYNTVIIVSILIGLFLGGTVLIVGVVKKEFGLGILGLFVCVIAGFIGGLILGIPALILFIWLITSRSSKSSTTSSAYPSTMNRNEYTPEDSPKDTMTSKEKLEELRKMGLITEEEYNKMKNKMD